MVGVTTTSFRRAYASSVVFSVNPRLRQRLLDTHRKPGSVSWGVTAPLSWVLVHTRVYLCPPRVCFPVLGKFCSQIPLASKVKFSGGSQSLCWIPRLGNLLWALELLQLCKNFFGIIVLQFVGRLLGSFMVGLMVTCSKRTFATHCASQVCCSQSPCPQGGPLLTRASTGDTHTLTGRPVSVSYEGH